MIETQTKTRISYFSKKGKEKNLFHFLRHLLSLFIPLDLILLWKYTQ